MKPCLKYSFTKTSVLSVVLLVYLIGTFNQGIFEIAHALSHQFTGEYNYHSHHSDLDIDHKHFTSELSEIAFKYYSHSPTIQDKILKQSSVDKIPQICPPVVFQLNLSELNNNNLFFNLQLPPTPLLQIFTPPPEFTT